MAPKTWVYFIYYVATRRDGALLHGSVIYDHTAPLRSSEQLRTLEEKIATDLIENDPHHLEVTIVGLNLLEVT